MAGLVMNSTLWNIAEKSGDGLKSFWFALDELAGWLFDNLKKVVMKSPDTKVWVVDNIAWMPDLSKAYTTFYGLCSWAQWNWPVVFKTIANSPELLNIWRYYASSNYSGETNWNPNAFTLWAMLASTWRITDGLMNWWSYHWYTLSLADWWKDFELIPPVNWWAKIWFDDFTSTMEWFRNNDLKYPVLETAIWDNLNTATPAQLTEAIVQAQSWSTDLTAKSVG